MRSKSQGSKATVRGKRSGANRSQSQIPSPNHRNGGKGHNWVWLVVYCASITMIVCMFSWVATFNLLPERALASGESVLVADYSLWRDYETINLDVVRLATAAAQGDEVWQSEPLDNPVTILPPATAIQITSQASPLPTLTPTEIPVTRVAVLPRTNTVPPIIPGNTATSSPTLTNPPPTNAPPTNPPPTNPPPTATNTPPSTATNTPTATNTATNTPTDTPTFTPTYTLTPSLTPTPTQIPPPPGVEVNHPGPPPDNVVYELCNTSIMIDLYDHPITVPAVPGSSLRFYEHWNANPSPPPAGTMYMDWIQMEVCADVGCSSPHLIFRWGDIDPNNNGNLPPTSPEDQAHAFYGNKVGILIDMIAAGVPNGVYQFVRVSTPPGSDCASDPSHNAQIDALYVQ